MLLYAKGSSGDIYLHNGRVYKKISTNEKDKSKIVRELLFYNILHHRGIIKLLGATEQWLILQYGGDPISNYGPFTATALRDIGGQILATLEYMHSLPVIHCGIRPDNVLVDYRDNIKLCGLGGANLGNTKRTHAAYDAPYRPPEAQHYVDTYSDIWALGCVLWELCHGCKLFTSTPQREAIKSTIYRYADSHSDDQGEYLALLGEISKMVTYSGKLRATATDLLNGGFFRSIEYTRKRVSPIAARKLNRLIQEYLNAHAINESVANFAGDFMYDNDSLMQLYVISCMSDESDLSAFPAEIRDEAIRYLIPLRV